MQVAQGRESGDGDHWKSPRVIAVSGLEHGLVYCSRQMATLVEEVEAIARHEVPVVLVLGESGTGKQLVARLLHQCSARSGGPFVEVNASALPETLAESELFGHEQGAYSDARARKLGMVELANRGTLFLDEIGDLALPTQAKLLTFIESRTFRRLGCTVERRVDARIVAATNRNLPAMIEERSFRLDLWYRLNTIVLQIPPLRERRNGIVPLAEHFLAQLSHKYERRFRSISAEAAALLEAHPWPGNVRELRSVIRRAVLLADSEVLSPVHLPGEFRFECCAGAEVVAADEGRIRTLAEVELAYIRDVLARCGGNRTVAARHLGITRQTLTRRLATTCSELRPTGRDGAARAGGALSPRTTRTGQG